MQPVMRPPLNAQSMLCMKPMYVRESVTAISNIKFDLAAAMSPKKCWGHSEMLINNNAQWNQD